MGAAERVLSTGGPVREGLDRELIVRAALSAIDADGAQGLTMRGLGQRLGVEAMSLYNYVSGREDLLEAVVAHLLEGLAGRLDEELGQTWQGYLQALAHEVRRIAVEHPNAFPLVATRHPATPWLRPPLRSLELVEDFLAHLAGCGFDDTRLVGAYRGFSSFLLGQLLLEAASAGADTAPVQVPFDEGGADIRHRDAQASMTLAQAPLVARLRPMLSQDRSDEEFQVGLEALLDRLEIDTSQEAGARLANPRLTS